MFLLAAVCSLLSILITINATIPDLSDLNGALSSFETLHINDLSHRIVKRSADNLESKEVHFSTLGRDFRLSLQKAHDILAPGFRVLAVDKDDRKRQVESIEINMYKGHDLADNSSYVEAYFEEGDDGQQNLVATIKTKQDVYVIEPSWRHLPESNSYSMISYRGSDIKMKDHLGPSYCGFVQPEGDGAAYNGQTEGDKHTDDENKSEEHPGERASDRYKRQAYGPTTPRKNTCSLLLVADYRFFTKMGQSSLSKTTTYLINLIQRVNTIYTNTQFGNFIKMTFGIKEIHIHEEWTVAAGYDHYNMERESWPTKSLLEVFSRNAMFRDFCLAHLFTHQAFEGGVLGLAYIAAPRQYSVGGICTQAYYKDGAQLFLNTGWSSSLNRYKRRLLTQEADLVTTHEFGHNWGSEHDPDTDECSPGSFKGGKHIMYTYSVSGYDPNNHAFSPCSQRSIGAVLSAKSQKCFSEPMGAFCGNALVEEGEECDPGPQSRGIDGDVCCNEKCQLKSNFQCSDMNDECCVQCMYASSNVVCHEAQDGSCESTTNCDGASKNCPPPPDKKDGEPCIGMGECQAGACLPYCEKFGKLSCACDNVTDSCKWCCRADNTSQCVPARDDNGNMLDLPEGMPCVQGYCNDQGVCEKQVQDLVQRIWDIIEQLGPNTIVAFMKANIVGTVIILSLFLWIPASCVVWRLDKKREREDREEINWMSGSNNTLVKPATAHRIRASTRVLPRKPNLTAAHYMVREPIVRPGLPAHVGRYQPPGYRFVPPPHSQPTSFI